MEKRTLLAILLSAVVWIGWFIFFKPDVPEPIQVPQQEMTKDTKETAEDQAVSHKGSAVSSPVDISRVSGAGFEREFDISTDKYAVTFTTRGAAIKSLKYTDRDVELVVPEASREARGLIDFALHFNEDEFLRGSALDTATWNYSTDARGVRFYTRMNYNGIPILIEKIFTFKNGEYSFKVSYKVTNLGNSALQLQNGTVIISPADMLGPRMDFENRYNEITGIYSKESDFETAHKGGGFFSEKTVLGKEAGAIQWAGLSSRYFLIIMIPESFAGTGVVWDNRENTTHRTGMYVRLNEVKPGSPVTKAFRVYLGIRDKEKLGAVDPAIIDAADVSKWIEPIRYFVIWSLLKINLLVGNLGWALVLFSLITKAVFMPLTMKSTNSMKRMQQLTPLMNEIKAKYKDKPDVMQKEMMKLYKEHKVNPMGGCLPILLQMPFFFALYSALINSIDLWQAPFILWMKDLSMPDTVLTISGFNLNILPIIMTATTFVQQKMTTVDTGTGQQQKIMMTVMPFIFIFIFWTMPSGLVLYWALQNIFQIAHQLVVNKFGKKEE